MPVLFSLVGLTTAFLCVEQHLRAPPVADLDMPPVESTHSKIHSVRSDAICVTTPQEQRTLYRYCSFSAGQEC